MAEVGIPALMAFFLEVNAAVMVCMMLGFISHEVTALWDVRDASAHRSVGPLEQHVYSFLEILPLIAGTLVMLVHKDEFLTLLGLKPFPPEFSLRMKDLPIPDSDVVAIAFITVGFVGIPYLEEMVRCYRFRRKTHAT